MHTQLCDKLGIEYPVVSFTHCKDVAVAVINAGGFAVLGEAMHTPDDIAAEPPRRPRTFIPGVVWTKNGRLLNWKSCSTRKYP